MKRLTFFLIFFLIFPMMILAQTEKFDNPLQLDEKTMAAILAAFGVGLFGLIAKIKKLLKTDQMTEFARNIAGYVISLLASAGVTIAVLATSNRLTWWRLLLYTAGVWLESSGIWEGIKEAVKRHK